MADIIKFRPRPEIEDTIGDAYARMRKVRGPKPRNTQRRGSPTVRKVLREIVLDSLAAENCLRRLRYVADADHDPRALVALMDQFEEFPEWNALNSQDECDRLLATIERVIAEYRKRFNPVLKSV